MDKGEGKQGGALSKVTFLGLALSLASLAVAMISGLGSRWGIWHFRTGFTVLGGAAIGGGLAACISLISLVWGFRRGLWKYFIVSCIGLALGLNTFGVPYSWYRAATRLPRIHDITTDTENPPRFKPAPVCCGSPAEEGCPEFAGLRRS